MKKGSTTNGKTSGKGAPVAGAKPKARRPKTSASGHAVRSAGSSSVTRVRRSRDTKVPRAKSDKVATGFVNHLDHIPVRVERKVPTDTGPFTDGFLTDYPEYEQSQPHEPTRIQTLVVVGICIIIFMFGILCGLALSQLNLGKG